MVARFGASARGRREPLKSIGRGAGVPLAFGGDGPLNPFLNMMFAITHDEQSTRGDHARAGGDRLHDRIRVRGVRGARKGSASKAGMLADVAVLTQDIFTVEAEQAAGDRGGLTIVNGRIVRTR